MRLSESEILLLIARELPNFQPDGRLQSLEGGNLNHVWRLEGKKKNLVVKVAPPYIVANPEVPLSADRIQFEANALRLFQAGNRLYSIGLEKISPPNIVFYNHKNHLLAMEDVGDLPHLGEACLSKADYAYFGSTLGKFIARLHNQTAEDKKLAKQFNNIDIQQTRFEVQYKSAAEYAKKGGIQNTTGIRKKTEALGRRLLQSGRCLVMGDLWPPSILVDGDRLRLIDWEFVHFGRPLQDIGHFAAHCWMMAHAASQNNEKLSFKKLWDSFWQVYQKELGSAFDKLIDEDELRDMATHVGAEILIRATGPFKPGYVYELFKNTDPVVQEAVGKSKQLILSGDFDTLWR